MSGGVVVYIVVFIFAFFAGSFLLARYGSEYCESPTDPQNFMLLVGASLIWPITVPLTAAILLLIYIAKLAILISGGKK